MHAMQQQLLLLTTSIGLMQESHSLGAKLMFSRCKVTLSSCNSHAQHMQRSHSADAYCSLCTAIGKMLQSVPCRGKRIRQSANTLCMCFMCYDTVVCMLTSTLSFMVPLHVWHAGGDATDKDWQQADTFVCTTHVGITCCMPV